MKTYGICNRQSARKHRQKGRSVTRLPSGRYMWSAVPRDKVRPYQQELSDSIAREAGRALHENLCRNPQFAEGSRDWPVSEESRAFKLDGYPKVRVGDEWMPKRRNQHTKPICIRAITPGGMIRFDRGEGGAGGWIEYTELCALLGKCVSYSA